MTQMITDFFKRQALRDEVHSAGVPQCVWSLVSRLNLSMGQAPAHNVVETADRKRTEGCFEG